MHGDPVAHAYRGRRGYPTLDSRIGATYAAKSKATLVRNLYDSYVRAIRWASDRISDRGVIGFVTNGYFIDSNSTDGLRACLTDEFQSVHVFNLRGNQRTSGEVSRQEGGKIFGSGARTPVAITVLVKNPAKKGRCTLRYHDIGDHLSREEKLRIVKGFGSITGIERAKAWTMLTPNDDHDWINQRDPAFEKFIPLGDKDGTASETIFSSYSMGVVTNRDAWVYSWSLPALEKNVDTTVRAYAYNLQRYIQACSGLSKAEWPEVESVIEFDLGHAHPADVQGQAERRGVGPRSTVASRRSSRRRGRRGGRRSGLSSRGVSRGRRSTRTCRRTATPKLGKEDVGNAQTVVDEQRSGSPTRGYAGPRHIVKGRRPPISALRKRPDSSCGPAGVQEANRS